VVNSGIGMTTTVSAHWPGSLSELRGVHNG
jgi:hypothetical protein